MREIVLYVHLRDDGGIFVVHDDGRQGFLTRTELDTELTRLKSVEGTLLYSRDNPERDASSIATKVFKQIVEHEVRIKLVGEVHPAVLEQLRGGATTLMAFAFLGDQVRLLDLLDRGADVGASDPSGYTALMYAAKAGHHEIVEKLLEHRADPNAADHQLSTPLMFAAQHGHLRVLRLLVTAGARANDRGAHGLTALGFALQNGHGSAAAFLNSVAAEE